MVAAVELYVQSCAQIHADAVVKWLLQQQISCQIHSDAFPVNNKQLLLLSQPTLLLDESGLWLAISGLKIQADWVREVPRLRRASRKSELIGRACLTKSAAELHILDMTAGLGHDGLLLAWFGAQMTLVERHPLVFLLLQDAKRQLYEYAKAKQYERLIRALDNMVLVYADGMNYLQQAQQKYDVIYLDPMFPPDEKNKHHALVKKQMQVLRQIVGEDMAMDEAACSALACRSAARMVVKRGATSRHFAYMPPTQQWQAETARFDCYDTAQLIHRVTS